MISQDKVYGVRIRSQMVVYDSFTIISRPYFAVLHGSVLRSYIVISYMKKHSCVLRGKLDKTETVHGFCIRRSYTPVFLFRVRSYFSVHDMEIYDHNTEPCKWPYFSVYDRRRPSWDAKKFSKHSNSRVNASFWMRLKIGMHRARAQTGILGLAILGLGCSRARLFSSSVIPGLGHSRARSFSGSVILGLGYSRARLFSGSVIPGVENLCQ